MQVLNPTAKKRVCTGQFNLSSFSDAESINVTDILLDACGIKDVQSATCSYLVVGARVIYTPAPEGCLDNDGTRKATNKKKITRCCHGHCCEIGENGIRVLQGYRRVFVQEPWRHWTDRTHGVDIDLLKQINITGESLRGLVDASTGGRKGLQMKRKINVFRFPVRQWSALPFGHSPIRLISAIDPDPSARDIRRGRWCSVDIDNILKISDGRIIFNDWPEKKDFKVTGEGGKPCYAAGSIFSACYNGYIEENFHRFEVPFEPSSRKCKKDNLLSTEIHINGDMVTTLGDSDLTESENTTGCKDGKTYKRVRHTWKGLECWCLLMLEFVVVYGPLPTQEGKTLDVDDGDDVETEMKVDQDPYNLLDENMKMKIDFCELSFVDNILKKGGTLHHIALRDSGGDGTGDCA